jgi:hypothetical protein
MINQLNKNKRRLLVIGLLVISLCVNGQIQEEIYLLDDKGNDCFQLDSAKDKIEIRKVLRDTYIVSYSYKYENQWNYERYYDELRVGRLNFFHTKQHKELKSGYLDTIYYWTRNYKKCCGMGNYREGNNTKTICAKKNNDLYDIIVLNYDDEIIQKGKSKYIFPFFWVDTLSFLDDNKLIKQIVHNDNSETIYFDKHGDRIEPIIFDSLMVQAKFPNSTRPFKQSLDEYFRRNSGNYPQDVLDNDIDGNIYIRFIITEQGNVECVEDLRRVPILSDICIERVKSLPKLEPATLNGIAVNSFYVYKFWFRID